MISKTLEYHKAASILILAVFTLTAGGSWFEIRYADRFYPGVFIGKEAVGGKTYIEVLQHFSTNARVLEHRGLRVIFQDTTAAHETVVPQSASGLTADNLVEYFSLGNWEEPIRQAQEWGHTGSFRRRISEKSALLYGTKHFIFSPTVYEESLASFLTREAENVLPRTEPARFTPDKNALVISREKNGKSIDTTYALAMVRAKLSSLDAAPLHITARPDRITATEERLKPFLAFASELSRTAQMVFRYEDRSWTVDGKTLASWLTLRNESEIGLDSEKLRDFLSSNIAPAIHTPPQNKNSRFEIRNHALIETFSGKPSRVINIAKTAAAAEEKITVIRTYFLKTNNLWPGLAAVSSHFDFITQQGTIDVPVQMENAPSSTKQNMVQQYGITSLVGTAETSFPGSSASRIHNIKTGTSKLSGILIAPGEEFSTITALGALTEDAGFVKEFVIKENRTVKELGGGLCQIATTLFRLALNAGLPVTERTNHSYIVSYYGTPGLDATTYSPKPDFRFLNDTGNYLLLQGSVENNKLTFELYGQNDGRTAEISKPVLSDERPAPPPQYLLTPDLPPGKMECSETPRKGVTADVVYTIYYPNGDIKKQNFHSVYEPWRKTCLVGVGHIEEKQKITQNDSH